jgi:V8-like Glu-specific endopeptidase
MKSPFTSKSDPFSALEMDELEDGSEFADEDRLEGPSSSGRFQTPKGPFGILTVRGRPNFRYAFTAEDALWLARFVIGEAGGRDDPGSRAVIWAMFNRYALFTYTKYRTFSGFVRAYSTPLQPVLNSGGAAARHYQSADFVHTGGNYTGKYAHVPRGQLGRYLRLQATPWSSLKASARGLAERALRGQIPNPIGNASDFENTVAYFRQNYGRPPKMDEWRAYNATMGRLKKRKWIGDVPGLTQYNTNAFFVSDRVAKLPQGAVVVTGAGQPSTSSSAREFEMLDEQPFELPEEEETALEFSDETLESEDAFEIEDEQVFEDPSGATRIQDRTAFTPRSNRKGNRDMRKVKALVLHQMAFSRGSDNKRYDTVNAHFAILPDGQILQLHPLKALLYTSNGFNANSIGVEFAGNFPSTKGRWWFNCQKDKKTGLLQEKVNAKCCAYLRTPQGRKDQKGCEYLTTKRHRVTPAQIEAGRYLVDHLIREIGLTHIYAHRQSSGTRENDPGPDIWSGVGQWAIEKRGLKDGGPGFKKGTGNPIPDEWRNWGRRDASTPELEITEGSEGHEEGAGPEMPEEQDHQLEWTEDELQYSIINSPTSPGDDRFRITPRSKRPSTLMFPFNTICLLERHHLDGKTVSRVTGTLIAPQVVLTAKHCLTRLGVRTAAEGPRFSRIVVSPGADLSAARDQRPADPASISAPAARFRVHPTLDFGVIILPKAFRRPVQFMRLQPRDDANTATLLTIAGYPCDKPRGTMWGHSERIRAVDISATHLRYVIDTCPGHSGSPIWLLGNNAIRLLLGIHTNGPAGCVNDPARRSCRATSAAVPAVSGLNGGVRVTCEVIDHILAWCREFNVPPPTPDPFYNTRCWR